MSVSDVGGASVSIPDPGFYSSGTLPWGIDAPLSSSTGTSSSSSSSSTSSTSSSGTSTSSSTGLSGVQQEYNTLQLEDTEELMYASFLTPAQGLANMDDVLAQAATLLPNADSAAAGSSSTSLTTLATDDSNLPTLSDLLSQSDSEAQQVLSNYADAPAGSSILDYQA